MITQKWGRFMEKLNDARAVFRGMWKWPELWAMIIAGSVLARLIVNAGVQEKLADYNKTQIEGMKADAQARLEENVQSKADRHWLHEELTNAKAALRRLERTVKTGEYP